MLKELLVMWNLCELLDCWSSFESVSIGSGL